MRLLIAIVISTLTLCSCSKESKIDSTVSLLLDWWPNPNHVPIYVGIEKKIFEKHGISLQVLGLQEPPDALAYVLSDQVDVALYYMPLCSLRYATNKDFKVIGKLHDHALYTFMCLESQGIETLEQFEGKRIGVFGDVLFKAAFTCLEEKGIHLGQKKTIQFDPIALLHTGALDLVSGVYWNIEPFQLRSQGSLPKCFTWQDCHFPDYPELVFISSIAFLQKDPSFSVRFKAALQESIQESLKDPQQAFALYLNHHPEKKHLSWEYEAWLATCTTLATSQKFSIDQLENFTKWLEDCKILPEGVNVKEMLD